VLGWSICFTAISTVLRREIIPDEDTVLAEIVRLAASNREGKIGHGKMSDLQYFEMCGGLVEYALMAVVRDAKRQLENGGYDESEEEHHRLRKCEEHDYDLEMAEDCILG